MNIDRSKWEWPGFEAVCPNCEDELLYIGVWPIWATDSSEVYEYWCPICGVVDTYVETWNNEEEDLVTHMWRQMYGRFWYE